MEPKAQALFSELVKIFPEGKVEYRFENELHKFRLGRNGPSHWLYISRTLIDDHTAPELIALLSQWQLFDAFRNSLASRWLFLHEAGVREVDDSFGRGSAL